MISYVIVFFFHFWFDNSYKIMLSLKFLFSVQQTSLYDLRLTFIFWVSIQFCNRKHVLVKPMSSPTKSGLLLKPATPLLLFCLVLFRVQFNFLKTTNFHGLIKHVLTVFTFTTFTRRVDHKGVFDFLSKGVESSKKQ